MYIYKVCAATFVKNIIHFYAHSTLCAVYMYMYYTVYALHDAFHGSTYIKTQTRGGLEETSFVMYVANDVKW